MASSSTTPKAMNTGRDAKLKAELAKLKAELAKLKVAQLRARASKKGLSITGTKAVLIARLVEVHVEREDREDDVEVKTNDDGNETKTKTKTKNDDGDDIEKKEEKVEVREAQTETPLVVEDARAPTGPAVRVLVSHMGMGMSMPISVEENVRWLFQHYGDVEDVHLVRDDDNERKYGDEAVVTMKEETGANAACAALHMRYTAQPGSSAFWHVQREDGVAAGVSGADVQHSGDFRAGTTGGTAAGPPPRRKMHDAQEKKNARFKKRRQDHVPVATNMTPAQQSGVMPNSAPLPSNAYRSGQSGGGNSRSQVNAAAPAALFRGGDVPGLPPSASVDAKWAQLYS